ncbi:chromate transporter [Solibacillus palustris]|uniref:chromate transporter n=1 Tax=Solibacillus palustris TaxID=2908203 RepID=UPI0038CD8243
MLAKQLHIFIAFFRSGILGFGGGPTTIPLVHKEVVKTYGWMTDEEFADVISIGNTLPGPIATKMAGYIGYRIGGWPGLITALFATVVPTVILIILLLSSLKQFHESKFVSGMTNGVIPVVAVMMGVLTYDFLKKSKASLGFKIAALIFIVSFIAIILLNIHPGIVISILLVLAIALPVKGGQES